MTTEARLLFEVQEALKQWHNRTVKRGNDRTGSGGTAIVDAIVNLEMRWIFRPQNQPGTDYGVDAHFEVTDDEGIETGRQIGAQVKTGPCYFREGLDEGFVIRPSDRHVQYWRGYALPVIVVLVDAKTKTAYWEFADRTRPIPSGGWKLIVPRTQTLGAHAINALADAAVGGGTARAQARFEERRLSEARRERIEELESVIATHVAQLATLPLPSKRANHPEDVDVLKLSFHELIQWLERAEFVRSGAGTRDRTAYQLAAEYLFFRESIEEHDAAKAVALLLMAEEWGKAGTMLLYSTILAKEMGDITSPSIVDVFEKSPLPSEIPLDLQIVIRTTQIEARQKHCRPVDSLLEDLDTLISAATPAEALAVMIATFREARTTGRSNPSRALRYILQAARLRPAASEAGGAPFPASLDATWPLLIELTASGIRSTDELLAWLSVLETVSTDAASIFLQDELSVVTLANRFWLAESALPRENRRWADVCAKLEIVEAWSETYSAGLLFAAARRARVIIRGEYQHDLPASIALATNVPAFVREQPRAIFLLNEIAASQFLYAGKYLEALVAFRDTLADQTSQSSLRSMALLKATQAAAATHDFDQAEIWVQQAQEATDVDTDGTSTDIVVGRAEHALTLWFGGKRDLAVELWDHAAEALFAVEEDSPRWRGCAVRFHWACGYLASSLRSGVPPVLDIEGRPYGEPRPGAFLIDFSLQAETFSENLRLGILLGLATISDRLIRDARTRRWSYAALELATEHTPSLRSVVGMLALPHLIADLRLSEAFELTLEMADSWEGAALPTGADPRVVSLSFGVVPAMLAMAQLERSEWRAVAESLAHAISSVSADPVFIACGVIIETTFISDAPSPNKREIVRSIRTSDAAGVVESPLRMLCDLCESILPDTAVDDALVFQDHAEQQLTPRLSTFPTMFRLHVAPFFRNIWLNRIASDSAAFTKLDELRAFLSSLAIDVATPRSTLLAVARHVRFS